MRRLLAVLALGAVVAACSEQVTTPEPGTPANAPSFGISNAPSESGIVLRGGLPFIFLQGVPSEGLEIVMGIDGEEFCRQYPDNMDPGTWSVIAYADKMLIDRFLTLWQAKDMPTQVWPWGGGYAEHFCQHIEEGVKPLATGFTRFSYFSSDYWATGRGAVVDMWKSHGLLTRPDGSRAVFSFQMQWRQWEPTKVTIRLQ